MADASSSPDPPQQGRILQFARLESKVDEGFWRRLSSLKLDQLGIDQSPIEITGFFAPCDHTNISQHLTLLTESLPSFSTETSLLNEVPRGNRNRCPVPGIIYNTNTIESFRALDKKNLLNVEAGKIWKDIWSGKAEDESCLLSRFLVLSFADLKKWKFYYWFAFPALVLDPPATLIDLLPASKYFNSAEAESLFTACYEWRNSSATSGVPFFFIAISNSCATLRPLKDFENFRQDHKLVFGFYDPSHHPNNPGWPLRNFLAFIAMRWNIDNICFFCYRERRGLADLDFSLVGQAMVRIPQGWCDSQHIPNIVGWEPNQGKLSSRCISLAQSMDPIKLAVSAADLNLKLMRWRMLPSLDLNTLSSLKCLLLGAGTLGCQVARMLMAWGVRKITLVDNGRVAMSNPLRQSLYTFEDCLEGGDLKAIAAAKSLKRIFPASDAEGVALSIPMPGHPVSSQEAANVIEDCNHLQDLVASHDVVFLLTDTRESRWLPALLCANSDKITITAALGFDTYLVMRHGAGPRVENDSMEERIEKLSVSNRQGMQRLGCYFCNDVVAPIDSLSNRTLDQQCTVTRPGLAPIASSIAVELLVGILHHPERTNAAGEISHSTSDEIDRPLGILPHQIRGSLFQYSQLTLVGHASDCCTACSPSVVSEYRKRGMEFVLQAINQPSYLEDLTGLTALMKSAGSFDLDWINEGEDE